MLNMSLVNISHTILSVYSYAYITNVYILYAAVLNSLMSDSAFLYYQRMYHIMMRERDKGDYSQRPTITAPTDLWKQSVVSQQNTHASSGPGGPGGPRRGSRGCSLTSRQDTWLFSSRSKHAYK